MSNEKELQAFRAGFCEKAAELGIKPSELLQFQKIAEKGFASTLSSLATGLKDNAAAAGLLAITAGALGGAVSAWGVKKLRDTVDPTGDILGSEDNPVNDAKKINLIARYRNAGDVAAELEEDQEDTNAE